MKKYFDINNNELKHGDKAIMTIIGLGSGDVEIEDMSGELCIYEPTQGYYPLKYAEKREDIILEKIIE